MKMMKIFKFSHAYVTVMRRVFLHFRACLRKWQLHMMPYNPTGSWKRWTSRRNSAPCRNSSRRRAVPAQWWSRAVRNSTCERNTRSGWVSVLRDCRTKRVMFFGCMYLYFIRRAYMLTKLLDGSREIHLNHITVVYILSTWAVSCLIRLV